MLKIAVTADGPKLDAQVGRRFGISPYLICVDSETMAFEAKPNPGTAGGTAAGVQLVVLAIGEKVDTVLTGFCSPTAMGYLSAHDIEVRTEVTGTVADAVEQYLRYIQQKQTEGNAKEVFGKRAKDRAVLVRAFKHSANQFATLLPTLVGVVLIIGLFNSFLSTKLLAAIFTGNPLLDTLRGAVGGSIFTGNPINSYIIGGQMLEQGISLFAVTAFMVSWVTVGIVQLPAEIAALGKKFALIRNSLFFIFSIAIVILTVLVLGFAGEVTF
jgi:predicted Fe-Mo cluster-binding NifX family protein